MAVDANGIEIVEDKITFTEKQQEFINRLIQDKQGEAARTVRAELTDTKSRLSTLESELITAKADLAKAKTPGDRKAGKEELETLQAQIDEMKNQHQAVLQEKETLKQKEVDYQKKLVTAQEETVNIRKGVAIRDAADGVGFVDVGMVTTLTSNQIKWDETKARFVVLGENGQERLNSSFEPMGLKEFYQEFASKNPFMVKADARSGTGSSENGRSALSSNGKYELTQIFGKTSDARLANKLALENKPEYNRLKILAKQAGLIS